MMAFDEGDPMTTDAGIARTLDPHAQDLLFRQARTAYSFTDRAVSDDELSSIYDVMQWAPTAMNAQPLRIAFVRSPQAKARLLPLVAEGNRQKVSEAPVTAILAMDIDFHEHLPVVSPQMQGARENLDSAIEARESMAAFNSALQAGYFILAVRGAGLSAGPMGGFDKAGVDEEFFAGTSWRSQVLVNIGHANPEVQFPRNPRLTLDQVAQFL